MNENLKRHITQNNREKHFIEGSGLLEDHNGNYNNQDASLKFLGLGLKSLGLMPKLINLSFIFGMTHRDTSTFDIALLTD